MGSKHSIVRVTYGNKGILNLESWIIIIQDFFIAICNTYNGITLHSLLQYSSKQILNNSKQYVRFLSRDAELRTQAGCCSVIWPPLTHHHLRVDPAGKLQIMVPWLLWESVGFEPLEQGQVLSGACVSVLGRVDVGVHQAWHEELAVTQDVTQRIGRHTGTVILFGHLGTKDLKMNSWRPNALFRITINRISHTIQVIHH